MAETPADFTLLEVGLGGRLDATNVVDRPRLTAITPVSIDHQQYLGETLPEIAGEKAGILKPGIGCIVGRQEPEALAVIEAAADAHAARRSASPARTGRSGRSTAAWPTSTPHGLLDLPLPNLIGAHQVANAGIALAALRALGLDEAACTAAVTRAEWPARLQRLRRGPLVAAAGPRRALARRRPQPRRRRRARRGADPPAAAPAAPRHRHAAHQGRRGLPAPARRPRPLAPRRLDPRRDRHPLRRRRPSPPPAPPASPTPRPPPSVAAAIAAITAAAPGCRILICGSLYLAGRVLRENG